MNNLAFQLGAWANLLPALWRKRVYKAVKWVGMLATLAVLVLPELDSVGLHWSGETAALAVASALVALTGHLADRNTSLEPMLDSTPAPESSAAVTPPAA